jgi:uncharacterized membrane protein YeaQ/YmgE (transglycosylase-associated protein family)
MIVVGWLAIGALIGAIAHRLRMPFPGGLLGSIAAGATGGFLGGGLARLLAHRGVGGFDSASLLIAAVGAVVLVTAVRGADQAEPPLR